MRPHMNVTFYTENGDYDSFIIVYSSGTYSCYVGDQNPTYVPMNDALFQEWYAFALYRKCSVRVSIPLAAPSGRHPVYTF